MELAHETVSIPVQTGHVALATGHFMTVRQELERVPSTVLPSATHVAEQRKTGSRCSIRITAL